MKSLRTQLQLSQKELAALIGTSSTTLCLYEKGLRNLPTAASLKLAQLQLHLLQNKQRPIAAGKSLAACEQKLYNKAETLLNNHACKAAADALRISMHLSHMKQQYQKLSQKLSLVYTLMQEERPGTRQMSLLQNLETDTLDAMARCAPARQMVAQYRLQLLHTRQQAALGIRSALLQKSKAVKN